MRFLKSTNGKFTGKKRHPGNFRVFSSITDGSNRWESSGCATQNVCGAIQLKQALFVIEQQGLQAVGETDTALASLQQLGLRCLGEVGELEQPAADEDINQVFEHANQANIGLPQRLNLAVLTMHKGVNLGIVRSHHLPALRLHIFLVQSLPGQGHNAAQGIAKAHQESGRGEQVCHASSAVAGDGSGAVQAPSRSTRCSRTRAPSFANAAPKWALTVRSEMNNRATTPRLESPAVRARATWASRSDRAVQGLLAGADPASRSSTGTPVARAGRKYGIFTLISSISSLG
jgi:hypothetical protein